MRWPKTTLGDVSLSIQTGPFGSQLHQSDYSEEGTPVVMPKDLVNGRISEDTIARVDDSHVVRLGRHVINVGDILYSRRGDVGRCAYAHEGEAGWLCGTGCLRVTVDWTKVDSKFVFYQLQLPETIGWVEKHAVGSTMLNLNTSILCAVPILLPPLTVQRRIADILSAYDDLIENNQKQIKLLEEAAQRLYREWFVELRFPGYETTPVVDGVPEGWERVPMGGIVDYEIGGGWGEDEPTAKAEIAAYVIRGTDIYGITHGEMMGIPHRYHPASNLSSRKLQPGDIVFEVSGGSRTEGVAKTLLITDAMLESWDEPVMCASFCKLMRFPTQMVAQYIFDMLQYMRSIGKTEEFEKKSASSIINYRWKDFLEQLGVILPPTKLLQRYAEVAGGLYSAIVVCSKTIEAAKKARDRLLPKLMSGEVEVW